CFLKALTNKNENILVFEKHCGVFKRIHQQVFRQISKSYRPAVLCAENSTDSKSIVSYQQSLYTSVVSFFTIDVEKEVIDLLCLNLLLQKFLLKDKRSARN
ncbi:MAG TPA: hypothetical protein VJA18_05910, partial [Candidatus Nanoarchaeia archaeon]|nr:hypothetical protein [Candidatus Nanoarchaeia archaeon]